MSRERTIIIGGNAGGMSAASQLKRLAPDMEITVFEKGPVVSYSACGIPYYVGGILDRSERLLARTPADFAAKDIAVETMCEIANIDPAAGTVRGVSLKNGEAFTAGWDKLLIATGAARVVPPIEGADADGVFVIDTVESGVRMREWIARNKPQKALIVGGGYIGLEMADAISCTLGMELTILEAAPQLLATLDADMAKHVQDNLEARGVRVLLGQGIDGFIVRDGKIVGARTKSGEIEADIAVLALGIAPNSKIAANAGIATGIKGAIVVDETMHTSAANIWAAGDCVQSTNILTGGPMHLALGAVANKQGRTAAFNMAGIRTVFPGVLGTAVCKICGQEIARTGLLERELTAAGRNYTCGVVKGGTIANYMSGSGEMHVKLIAEMPSEKIVGAQIVGDTGAAKRIDTMAAIITAGMTLEEMLYLDFSYAPPISPLWDPTQQAARTILSRIRGERP